MQTLVIINPAAGGGLDFADVKRRLAAELDAEFVPTEASGHAVDLAARAAATGYSQVVAVGGDGTVGQVAAGLWRGTKRDGEGSRPPRLGLIPVGTGNDLARALGLPLDMQQAARVVRNGRVHSTDLVRASAVGLGGEDRFLTNAAVAGFCGRIGDSMSPAFRRRWRRLGYPVAAVRQLPDLRPYRVHIDADGDTMDARVLMVVIANSRFAGGHVPLAPDARTDDGLLDVVMIEKMSPLALATLVPRVFRGTHTGHPGVRSFRARSLRMESDVPMWINLDGDTWHAGPASFHVIPSALEILVP